MDTPKVAEVYHMIGDDSKERKAVEELAKEINAILANNPIDTVLNSLGYLLAGFLAGQAEADRQILLDSFIEVVKLNTRALAGEATA